MQLLEIRARDEIDGQRFDSHITRESRASLPDRHQTGIGESENTDALARQSAVPR